MKNGHEPVAEMADARPPIPRWRSAPRGRGEEATAAAVGLVAAVILPVLADQRLAVRDRLAGREAIADGGGGDPLDRDHGAIMLAAAQHAVHGRAVASGVDPM